MVFKKFRDESRKDYGHETDKNGLSLDRINAGSLMRIADGVETMAKGYKALEDRAAFWEKEARKAWEQRALAERRVAALRGVITRMKRSSTTD